MQLYRNSSKVDIITLFSLRPPELTRVVDMVGHYFCWFFVASIPLKEDAVAELLDTDLQQLAWVDRMKYQVLLRVKALPKLLE